MPEIDDLLFGEREALDDIEPDDLNSESSDNSEDAEDVESVSEWEEDYLDDDELLVPVDELSEADELGINLVF